MWTKKKPSDTFNLFDVNEDIKKYAFVYFISTEHKHQGSIHLHCKTNLSRTVLRKKSLEEEIKSFKLVLFYKFSFSVEIQCFGHLASVK